MEQEHENTHFGPNLNNYEATTLHVNCRKLPRTVLRLKIFFGATFVLTLLTATNTNAQSRERCLIPPSGYASVRFEQDPADLLELGVDIGLVSEGTLSIGGTRLRSPTGSWTITVGPYDPASGRLYLWGWFKNGWVNVHTFEQDDIRPGLYSPADDIDDVTYIDRSEALGVQFYSGWTAPHWLTGRQSYRVFVLSGTKMTRLRALEELQLRYVGDDPEVNLAVFSDVTSGALKPNDVVWFDGTDIVQPPDNLDLPIRLCEVEN